MSPLVYPILLLITLLWALKRRPQTNTKGLPLPPGPKGLPVIGCLLGLPSGKYWIVFDSWLKQYGDIISFRLVTLRFVVLGSSRRTDDLLEKRSAIYSHKHRLPFLFDVVGFDTFSLRSYDAIWRQNIRLFEQHFHPSLFKKYHPTKIRETRALLRNLLVSPNLFRQHIQICLATVMMGNIYDIRIRGLNDPYIVNGAEVYQCIAEGAVFGRFWIDYFPSLIPFVKYIPSWVPGTRYKIQAEKWKAACKFMEYKPFEDVKADLAKGISRPCIVSDLLESIASENASKLGRIEAEALARGFAITTYFGSTGSTTLSVLMFFLAMVKYPEAQRKAQAEIDSVIGMGRLPDFGDRKSLTYLDAMIKEVTRWRLVVPNVAHMAGEDDEYDGYFIPKNTIVIGNTWSILHDPNVYPAPEEFRPERFLQQGNKKPAPEPSAVFGYGRRICPGRFFSDDSLFIVMASVLATFDILPPNGEDGNPIDPDVDYGNASASSPSEFACIIKPRSTRSEALVRESEVEYEAAV